MKRTELHKLLYANEVEQLEIAEVTGRSSTYINTRVTGKKPFTLDEVYLICDRLRISYEDIPRYFQKSKELKH